MPERTTRATARLEIFDILDKLESVTGSAAKVPLTGRAMVNTRDIQILVNQLRRAIPNDVSEAAQIIGYKETIVTQAQAEASKVKTHAEQEAEQKMSETQIVKDAKKKAEGILNEARKKAEEMVNEAEKEARTRVDEADNYAREVLHKLEEELNTLLMTSRRGIEALEKSKEPTSDEA